MEFYFEMFEFLSQFLEEYPSSYSIFCCLTLLIWLYLLHIETNADRNRLDVHVKGQKKLARNNPIALNTTKDIPWIKGKVEIHSHHCYAFKSYSIETKKKCICTASIECNRFPTNIATNFVEKSFTNMPIIWTGFSNRPRRMLFQNTGHDGNCL